MPARISCLLDFDTGQLDGDIVDIVQELLAGGEPEGGGFDTDLALGYQGAQVLYGGMELVRAEQHLYLL